MHKYVKPRHWLRYDPLRVASELAEAKAAVLSLTTIPYQRRRRRRPAWVGGTWAPR